MSHFTTVKTQILDAKCLVKALNDVGFKTVEHHANAQHLYGYQGDRREQVAEVIVRRNHVGRASNDIGFKRQDDGSYTAIISEYDRKKYDGAWLNQVCQRYAYHTVVGKLEEQGFTLVSEAVRPGERIHLSLRRAY